VPHTKFSIKKIDGSMGQMLDDIKEKLLQRVMKHLSKLNEKFKK
jgi:hypothetical protein